MAHGLGCRYLATDGLILLLLSVAQAIGVYRAIATPNYDDVVVAMVDDVLDERPFLVVRREPAGDRYQVNVGEEFAVERGSGLLLGDRGRADRQVPGECSRDRQVPGECSCRRQVLWETGAR